MADKKVRLTSLPTLNTIQDDAVLLLNQSGSDYKAPANKILQTSNNLSEVSPPEARANLNVYDKTEVDDKLNSATVGKIWPSLDGADGANAAIASGEIPDNAYFFVRSPSDTSISDEYRNVAGTATATGKSTPSTEYIDTLQNDITEVEASIASIDNKTDSIKNYFSEKWHWSVEGKGGPSETAIALDNDFGLWLAGLKSSIQDYIEQLIPKNIANRYHNMQYVLVAKNGIDGLLTISDSGDLRVVGMDDILQVRLDTICSTTFSHKVVGYQFVIFTSDLKSALFAIDNDGGVHVPGIDGALQDKLGESRASIVTKNGVPAVAWDGEVVWSERPVLTTQKLTDAGVIFSYVPGGEAVSGSGVMYIPSIREMPVDAERIEGGASSGQSLNTPKDVTGNTNLVNRDPAYRGRLLAAANGKPEGDGGRGMGEADRTTINDMSYPMYRQGNVLPMYNALMSFNPGNLVFMHAGFAVGGYPFSKIKKGTVPYNKGLALIQLYKQAADAVGKPYVFRFMTFEHGESDNDNGDNPNPGDYLAKETEYFSDFQADVTPITGQTDPFTVVIGQVGSRVNTKAGEIDDEGNPTGEIIVVQPYSVSAVDQTAYIRQNPSTAIMYGPKYPLNWLFSDGTMSHLSIPGKVLQGEYTAQAIHWHLYDDSKKGTWTGLKVNSITLNGTSADLLCDVPYPPMVIDSDFIIDSPGKGISLQENSATVTEVSIVGGNTIRVTFDKEPSTTDVLLIGFTNTQPHSNGSVYPTTCFRDSSPVLSKWISLNNVPFPLYNWMCLDRIPLTGEL
ncbi:TPA: hypothetical protein ACG0BA_002254 [Serratia odorifera]